MAIRIEREDWTNELEEKYTVFPEATFGVENPRPRDVYYFFKDDIAVPFAEWSKFYNEFPENYDAKSLNPRTKYKGNLREKQISIYEEAWEKIQKKHYVFLHLSTAVGKTFLGIYLTFKLGKKFIMTTYRTKLFPQWMEAVEKFSTMKVQHIKTGKTKIDERADGWLVSPEIMKKMPEHIKLQVGTLILDEAHELVTPTRLDILLTLQPNYLICLTATHDRADGLEKILYLMCGSEEEFVDRFTHKEKMKVIKVETGVKGRYCLNPVTGKIDWQEMVKSIISQEKRADLIVDLVKKHPEQRIMLMAVFNEQFSMIEKKLTTAKISFSRMYAKYNEEKDKSTNVLLAQEKKGGVGLDDQTLQVLIFLDSITDVRQKEGRIRGDVPIIYDLVDETNIHKKHWKIRKEWYCKRMNLPEGSNDFYEVISYEKKEKKPTPKKMNLIRNKERAKRETL